MNRLSFLIDSSKMTAFVGAERLKLKDPQGTLPIK
jgi:hypothetical protein